ncbi:spore germination protein [Paenibacillus hexagrammi]|uniref:spore germination protein n=1 Tax=Paenibacillus hexagrammi TaxID=2908839 RepID=UPI0028832C85|nr:spore germination protein [Paenibacillus sp. YPD9-1]
MASMEDFYQNYWISRFVVILRMLGLFVSTTLASWYVGLVSYNPEVLRVQLSLSIAGSRASVPYPSYVEVFFMLIMTEMLIEASIRLPKSIGSTATTVGGLILGQAATQAGLVSNIMIILIAAVAISNFVIPINMMSFGMRVAKYVLLLFTTMFGLMGLIAAFIGLVAYLASMESYGQPYLKLYFESSRMAAKKSDS